MSYDIVRSIRISNGVVYFSAAPNNVHPRTFERFEVPKYTEIYQEQGMKALLKEISKQVHNGNYHLRGGSKLTSLLEESHQKLRSRVTLVNFLDEEHAADFMANVTARRLEDPSISIHNDWVNMELAVLEGLRYDKKSVLEICKKNPQAFHYAAGEISCDRVAAKEYIQQCSHMILFSFPRYFNNDKELALLALPHNGCIFRDLSSSLRSDKDIIRMAFDQNLNGRRFFEHLPDLIPSETRADKEFMRELVTICPSLHVHRAPDILTDFETAKAWASNGKWFLSNLHVVPQEFLADPNMQAILLSRIDEPMAKGKLKNALEDRGVQLAIGKPSLSDQISDASTRTGPVTDKQTEIKGREER